MRLAWATDIHLDSALPDQAEALVDSITQAKPDAVLLTGDISTGSEITAHLHWLQKSLNLPVYFVLGNHDLWWGTIHGVHRAVRKIGWSQLRWLGSVSHINLTETTVLVGEDGWYDGRAGNYQTSSVRLNDWKTIQDFRGLDRDGVLDLIQKMADRSTLALREKIRSLPETYTTVVVATHVPPFVRASLYRGNPSGNDHAPFYVNERMGQVLADLAYERPEVQFRVLCGHTHFAADYSPLDNLRCQSGGAEYQFPKLQGVLEFP